MRGLLVGAAALGLWLTANPVAAIEAPEISAALSARGTPTAVVQSQIEQYVLSKMPPLPRAESVEEWERIATEARRATFERVVFRGAARGWRESPTHVEWLDVIEQSEYVIRKLRYEIVPGMWAPALLYEPRNLEGRVPVVMNVNGHDSAGKAADYKQIRCINQAKRGMLALNLEWFGMGQLNGPEFNHYTMNQLDLCGTSGIACFYLAMSRGLDLLLDHEHADPERVAVAGLSGGGWQTIFISSLDERVRLCDPVAGYSSFRTRALFHSDLGDSEQTPTDLATTADYALLTAMRAPRPTLLTFNDRDNCCFAAGHALPPLLEAARPAFALYGASDRLTAHINHLPGTHNFDQDNREALYRMIGRHFYDGQPFDPREIPCQSEVYSADVLQVPLPSMNLGFQSLARALAEDLPRPAGDAAPEKRRSRLREILRYEPLAATSAELLESSHSGGVDVNRWALNLSDRFTIPATEFVPDGATRCVMLLADDGRASQAARIEGLLREGVRVLAIDPYNTGESKIPSRDFLFGLLVSAVGSRPLGVLSAQTNAAADWWAAQTGLPLEAIAVGRRTSLGALCAAAAGEGAIVRVTCDGGLTSLKQIISENLAIPNGPELFTFGLLEEFDIPELEALANRAGD
ncbi:MAG: hypothetical protein KF774_17490 [Planctomyces sp.]|nr:hypothetical protein [Planctomyces sp.]